MKQFIIKALIMLCAVVIVELCRRWVVPRFHKSPATKLQVGGIYSIADGDGRYGVAKLLVFADDICHLRIYKQKFQSRPKTIDVGSLSLGKPGDPDGFGMGHIPLREAGFLKWQPMLITNTTVTPDELEGYEIWKKDGGGVF